MPETTRFRTSAGLWLVADVVGPADGRPVLLLHGGGQTRHAWGGTARALGARGFRAVSVDLRGHGESDWSADGEYRLPAFAADVKDVARSFATPPVSVGASLGGLASLLAEGTTEGGVFSALVLVDIGPRLEQSGVDRILGFMGEHVERGFASLDDAADAVASYLPHRKRPKDLGGLSKNLRLDADGRYRWHWDPRFLSGRASTNATSLGDELLRATRGLRLPTLLVRGKLSDILSEDAVAEFRQLAPHAQYVDVREAAHMVAGDDNDAFTEAVVRFLEG